MIRLTKAPKPRILEDHAEVWTREYLELLEAGDDVPDGIRYRYRHAQIKETLRTESSDKCIYCESKISHVFPGKTDHLAPVSRRPDLYLCWENLGYVCKECNRSKGAYYSGVEPLIDPFWDEPSEHLAFYGPTVFHLPGDMIGLRTIRKLKLCRSALLERRRELLERLRLVATTEASRSQIPPLSDPWVAVLRHQTIPVVSYPYEWCFSMLQDAALLQIDLLLAALDEGMTLKDATPFNIQWIGTRPVFIDIGSFTAAAPGEPWAGYRQFCEMFLYPLFLQAYKDVPFHPWLRGSLEGVEAGHINRLMSARDRLRPGVFPHVYLLSKLQARYASTPPQRPKGSARGRVHRGADHAQREAHAAPRRRADVAPRAVDLVGVRRRQHIRSDRSRAQEAVCPSGRPIGPPRVRVGPRV